MSDAAPAAETPFKRFFARLDGVVSSQKDGVGRMLVRGVPQPEDSDDDHDDAEDEATRAKLTDEDMAHMRFIDITKGRAEQLKAMQRLLLGKQAGDSMLCFNTSFSYHIMSAYATFSRCKVVGAAERFDGCDLDASPSSSNLDESRRKNRATIHDGYLSRSIEAVLKRNVTLTRCVVSQPHGMVLLLS